MRDDSAREDIEIVNKKLNKLMEFLGLEREYCDCKGNDVRPWMISINDLRWCGEYKIVKKVKNAKKL